MFTPLPKQQLSCGLWSKVNEIAIFGSDGQGLRLLVSGVMDYIAR